MDKWLKKPVAKKRKHGEFSYFRYINYMTIYSHKFLTDCKLSELRIALINRSEDSVYCGYCLVFAKSGCFSTSGYIDWKNAVGDKRGNFKKHEQCKQHQDAQQQATEFLRVCDSKERKDVYSFLSTAYKEKIERNRKILLSIVDVIVTLGKRNIGLRKFEKISCQKIVTFR